MYLQRHGHSEFMRVVKNILAMLDLMHFEKFKTRPPFPSLSQCYNNASSKRFEGYRLEMTRIWLCMQTYTSVENDKLYAFPFNKTMVESAVMRKLLN